MISLSERQRARLNEREGGGRGRQKKWGVKGMEIQTKRERLRQRKTFSAVTFQSKSNSRRLLDDSKSKQNQSDQIELFQ